MAGTFEITLPNYKNTLTFNSRDDAQAFMNAYHQQQQQVQSDPQAQFLQSKGYKVDSMSPQNYGVSDNNGNHYNIDKSTWGDATNWSLQNRFPELSNISQALGIAPHLIGQLMASMSGGPKGGTVQNFNNDLGNMVGGLIAKPTQDVVNAPNQASFAANAPGQAASQLGSQVVQNVTAPYNPQNYSTQHPLNDAMLALQGVAPVAAAVDAASPLQALQERRIPQRLYAEATGTGDVLAKTPEAVQANINEGNWGKRGTLINLAEDKMNNVVGPKINTKLQGLQATPQDVQSNLNPSTGAAPGEQEAALNARTKVGNDLLNSTFTEQQGAVGPNLNIQTQQIAPLADLNAQKTVLASRGAKLYDNPDAKISAIGRAQKAYADAIRNTVRSKVANPKELDDLNQKYYQYSSLGGGLGDLELNADKTGININPLDPKGTITDLVTGGTAGKTGLAITLDRAIKAGNVINGYNTTALKWLMGLETGNQTNQSKEGLFGSATPNQIYETNNRQ